MTAPIPEVTPKTSSQRPLPAPAFVLAGLAVLLLAGAAAGEAAAAADEVTLSRPGEYVSRAHQRR